MKRLFCLICFLTLFSGCTYLWTPETKGVVVDSTTGKPIEKAHVYAKWRRIFSNVGGHVYGGVSHYEDLTTGRDGYFEIPSHLLINPMPLPLGQWGLLEFMVYAHGYKNRYGRMRGDDGVSRFEASKHKDFAPVSADGRMTVKLIPITDPKTFLYNTRAITSFFGYSYRHQVEAYVTEDKQMFVDRFGATKWEDFNIQDALAQAYDRLGDYQSELRKLEEIKDHEKGKYNPYLEKRIEDVKKKLAEKSGK